MKIICQGLDLADAVNKVTRALGVNKNMPILECIKLEAKGSTLTLSATDCYFSIIKKINAEVRMEGTVVVNGRMFADFIKKLTNEQIELEEDEHNILLKYTDSFVRIAKFNLDEFPDITENEAAASITMKQNDMKTLAESVLICSTTDDSKAAYQGVKIEVSENRIRACALDGFRIGIRNIDIISGVKNIEFVIHNHNLSEIIKLLDGSDDTFTLHISDTKISVDMGHTKIISVLMKYMFIDYNKIISKEFESEVTLTKAQLEDALERASAITRNDKRKNINLSIKEDIMVVNAVSEQAEMNEKIVINLKGKNIDIGFNIKYLQDCLKVINDDYIKFKLKSAENPLIIVPVENDNYLYLVLPVIRN